MERPIRVGITHGDFNGISYEVMLKALADEAILELFTPVIFGSADIAAHTLRQQSIEGVRFHSIRDLADIRPDKINLVNVCSGRMEQTPGVATPEAGKAAVDALDAATQALAEGDIDILVTAPINKNNVQTDTFHFPGHTEYLEARFADPDSPHRALMVLFAGRLRVALVTTHLPISELAAHITEERVYEAIKDFNSTLRMDFGCERPKIAVLGLNPHCGDGGLLGNEEKDVIIPAIKRAKTDGILAFGPYAADGFFSSGSYHAYDGVLAMYHDQGLAPFKALAGGNGVNFTAGLPIVRTSPDHGTGYDIAGQGVADPTSMREAIYAAIDIYRNRLRYLQASAHPLEIRAEKPSRPDKAV